MVGCARKSVEESARPPEVVAPPNLTPADKVVKGIDVVVGERRNIARAQVGALKLSGAPLSLHRNILDISWTEATIEFRCASGSLMQKPPDNRAVTSRTGLPLWGFYKGK